MIGAALEMVPLRTLDHVTKRVRDAVCEQNREEAAAEAAAAGVTAPSRANSVWSLDEEALLAAVAEAVAEAEVEERSGKRTLNWNGKGRWKRRAVRLQTMTEAFRQELL